MSLQLALNLRLRDGSSFANFCPGRNREALEAVRAAVDRAVGPARSGDVVFLAGPLGSGRTHLLEAACRLAQERGLRGIYYVPLAEAAALDPLMLEGMEQADLVCLDDVGRISRSPVWERALFALCEPLRAAGGTLLAAGDAAPARLALTLPDLVTRLGWGPVYQLQLLSDDERLDAIRLRARNRGLELSPEVTRYILSRYPRDMASLFDLLDRIDRAALASQRRITIPFVREFERS